MAIAHDNSSIGKNQSSLTTTVAHTVNSNTDGVLIVGIDIENGPTPTVSSVTYNGVTMTQMPSVGAYAPFGNRNTGMYYLFAPSTGTNNIVVTYSASTADWKHVCGLSYTGVSQTGMPDASNTYVANPTSNITQSLTTIADNAWLVGFTGGGSSPTAGTATTIRKSQLQNDYVTGIDSNGAKTPAGSYSMSVTQASNYGYMWLVSIAPATAAAATSSFTPQLMTLKVG